jgi:signal transduction histidine kinase
VSAPAQGRAPESVFESSTLEARAQGLRSALALGWRRRAMVVVALLGCLGLLAMARWLAATPYLDAQWAGGGNGSLILQDSALGELKPHLGQTLVALGGPGGTRATATPIDALLLHRSPRWQVDDVARRRQIAQHEALARALEAGAVQMWFADGQSAAVPARPRGLAGLGLLPWPLGGLALLLTLFAAVVLMARPRARNLLFGGVALCQAGNLLIIALETTRGIGLPGGAAAIDFELRLALDACTGAAIVTAFCLQPLRLPQAGRWIAALWLTTAAALPLIYTGLLQPSWWWAQGLCLAQGLAALAAISQSYRLEANPYAIVMRRFCLIALATLVLVTGAVAASAGLPGVGHGVALGASVAWYLFLASLLLLTPFLARSRQVLREFAMLAGISTVAASIDLLFVAVFSLSAFASLAVAVFVALALYGAARQYILDHMLGAHPLTAERIFDQLYRAARDVQAKPHRFPKLLAHLLRELFEPLEVQRVSRVPPRARVVGGGAALVVPIRAVEDGERPLLALQLRFAQRGQRLFTHDDARLAERVMDQLRRAAAYDQAVERGRHEERLRIAQDLHDDIGARLLTLMYQAPTPEMEDYIRHTLQDLKTLTRGLAAAEHRLSDACAEWKADLSQRLAAAQARLGWAVTFDRDLSLTVVQWSALTRVLRELVSNALYHGHASAIDVTLELAGPRLALAVSDDGDGRNPEAWAHGLGLGGVRKRVKVLGGRVQWRENQPRGITCEVAVEAFVAPS